MKFAQRNLATFVVAIISFVMLSSEFQPANSQTGVVSESSSSSSSTDEVVKGYAFKYKERFRNYAGQIDDAQTKGWLDGAKAATFKNRLEELRTQEVSAGKNGYSKTDVDALDKAVTKFNMDLTDSEQKK